ncbi:MAG: hypothetical protein QM532_04520, partial [Cyanobium sp. MAG06]|nr:hypothetical protein [Cyanobium sp. MAG06]
MRDYTGEINLDDVVYITDTDLPVEKTTFYFEGGLRSLIKHYNILAKPIHKNVFYVEKSDGDVGVEISLQYIDDITTKIVPFANNIYNPEGGTHITGFRTALTRLINNYARKNN